MDPEQLQQHLLVDILGGSISAKRAQELLEATNGSVERAVELHFHHPQQQPSSSLSNKASTENPGTESAHLSLTETSSTASPRRQQLSQQTTPSSRRRRTKSTTKSSSASASLSSTPTSAHKRKSTQATLDSLFSTKSPKKIISTSHTEPQRKQTRKADKNEATIPKEDSDDDGNDCEIIEKDNNQQSSTTKNGVDNTSSSSAPNETISFDSSFLSTQHERRNDDISNNISKNLLDVPYATVVKQLTIIANTTKRTIKLQAFQDLFVDIIRKLLQHWHHSKKRQQPSSSSSAPSNNNRPHVQARVLHMVLDLILGKITLLTKSNDDKSNKDGRQQKQRQQEEEIRNNQESTYVTNITLQVSGAAITKALQTVLGVSFRSPKMRQLYRQMGDLGDVSAKALEDYSSSTSSFQSFFTSKTTKGPKKTQQTSGGQPSYLTVAQVHDTLQDIATVETGKGSQTRRHDLLVKLFRAASQDKGPSLLLDNNADTGVDSNALRFLVRAVLGNMRLGATLKTVLTGLAMAVSSSIHISEQQSTGESNNPEVLKGDSKKPASVGDRLQKVYAVCPRFHEICLALLEGGVERAEEICSIRCGYPVEPMLANPAASMDDVEAFLKKGKGSAAVAEWKYDGVRCQAHYDAALETAKGVRLFSRHMLDQTIQYQDAAASFIESAILAAERKGSENEPIRSFVCDAEIVAVEANASSSENKRSFSFKLLPFQDLRRGTGGGNNRMGQVRVYCFDLLYLNGKSLLKVPLWKRLSLLNDYFVETAGFTFAQSICIPAITETSPSLDRALITNALKEAVDGGAEGLMVKLTGERAKGTDNVPEADAGAKGYYEAGTRSYEWLKVKRDYIGGYADTIDVVPIGAWYGDGRKAQAGFLSPVLLAVYDEDDDVFCSISRCLSFSDAMYRGMKEFYFYGRDYSEDGVVEGKGLLPTGDGSDEKEPPNSMDGIADLERINCFPDRPSSSVIVTNENPPIWFKPLEVFEVSFADLSLSRVHTAAAGMIDEERGIALRFPRFKRKRPDKKPTQATTCAQIAQLYRQQSKVSN